MSNLTPEINTLLETKHSTRSISYNPTPETADEFLKEAYRINSHITSLLKYLQSIRTAYLTPTQPHRPHHRKPPQPQNQPQQLTDTDRDEIDTSTTLLLRSLSTSISNLSSAESLRQETESSLLRKKYGVSASNILFRWAGGAGALSSDRDDNKSVEQARDEEVSRVRKTVRESVLWYLRRGLESAAERQRELVERRIERVREKERSALYKASGSATVAAAAVPGGEMMRGEYEYRPEKQPLSMATGRAYDTAMSSSEAAEIESQLSAEQLQLFAEENDSMLRYYEDTLGKVQNAEKSLLEISSLQQTLVSHLATQEEYIGQLVTDAGTTQTNIGEGNKELKRATEQRSTAQAVFWGTVGICTWLVVWDLIF